MHPLAGPGGLSCPRPERVRGVTVGITAHGIGASPGPVDGRTGLPLAPDCGEPVYLRTVCELLWPPPTVVSLDGAGWRAGTGTGERRGGRQPGTRDFLLVPGVRRPPLLVPAGARVGAAAVRHYSGQRSSAARLTARLFSGCLASGLGGAVFRGRMQVVAPPGADTIERYLADVVSQDVCVSMYLGPTRANRKPVLQLLTADGAAVAFAKVGVNPLTTELVRRERAALARLAQAGLGHAIAPRVLHHGTWRDLDVLVVSALPAWLRRRPLRPGQLAAAMAEVAQIDGLASGPLAESGYLQRLRSRLASAAPGPDQAALLASVDKLAARAGATVLSYGAWHGDWAPWNMSNTDRGLFVWDWERFTTDVPLGFDALHHRLQTELGPGHRDPRSAAADCVRHAAALLEPFDVPAGHAPLVAMLYLTDLATRYLVDQQAKVGARHGALNDWLIPVITDQAASL